MRMPLYRKTYASRDHSATVVRLRLEAQHSEFFRTFGIFTTYEREKDNAQLRIASKNSKSPAERVMFGVKAPDRTELRHRATMPCWSKSTVLIRKRRHGTARQSALLRYLAKAWISCSC